MLKGVCEYLCQREEMTETMCYLLCRVWAFFFTCVLIGVNPVLIQEESEGLNKQ